VALADFILVASSFTAETFRRQGVDPAKIRLLSLGVDSSPSPPSRTPSHTPGKGPLKLLYAGRLDQFKGISYLLEAFRLARKEADVSLTLVGPGTKEVRAKIACHEGVEVLPALHHAELRALYPRFHAFAFPSLGDGFGLVVLEALAAGLYVFASDRCCAPDLNLRSQDGIVLPAREPAVWAGAFIELASRGHHPPPYGLSSGSAHGHSRTLTWDHYRHGSQQLVSDLLGSTAFPPMSTSTPFPTGEAT
jgi:glycosyltransferase involved in cell wall biosynthesis